MRKTADAAKAVLKGILGFGFGIQTVLGIFWMCFSIRDPQTFPGNWGALYRGLQELTGERKQILCVIQLGVGFYAGYCLLRALCPERGLRNMAGSLALLTFPMAMQCHLSIAPYSLISSFFLLELAVLVPGLRRSQGEEPAERQAAGALLKGLAGGGGCWFFLTLLLPEYFLLGAIPLGLTLLLGLREFRKAPGRLARAFLLLAVCGGITAGAGTLAGDGNYLPDRETVSYSLFHRISWPTLWVDWERWPEEVRGALDYSKVWEASEHADVMEEYFRPRMLEVFGEEKAQEYYRKLSGISWDQHKSRILRQTAADALGYCATPLILQLQLRGRGYDSYSGRNYEFMTMCAPMLTKYYVRYGCRWFGGMLAVMALLALLTFPEHRRRADQPGLRVFLLCLFWAGTVAAFYALRGAGKLDYKATVGGNLLWLAAALFLCRPEASAEDAKTC